MHGQGIKANGYNPLVDVMPLDELEARIGKIRNDRYALGALPSHEEFINKYCKAENDSHLMK